jgi:signal transduction histidine kinase
MVNVLSGSTGIDISYQNLTDIERLDENREVMLYRIVQELVQNAIRHASPSVIMIQLSQHNGTLSLVIEDDGSGFSSENVSGGLGLQSIESRVQFLNGSSEIISTPNTGTSVTVEVPVRDNTFSQGMAEVELS